MPKTPPGQPGRPISERILVFASAHHFPGPLLGAGNPPIAARKARI
jgi:hypothetical protein